MPTGHDYRFLYIFLCNKGHGWKIADEEDTRTIQKILEDYGCTIIHSPQYEGDMVVGAKDKNLYGLANLYGFWAINLSEYRHTS